MPDKPVPLREALKEAMTELVNAHRDYNTWQSMDHAQALATAENRVNALLSQIPIDLEERE